MIKLRLLMILSLMVLVPSSSFSIDRYLTSFFSQYSPASKKVIAYGVRHFNPAAMQQALAQQPYGSNQWLFYQAFLATKFAENAIELGQYWQNKNSKKAQFWYQKALQLNKTISQFDVARWYLSQQQWQQAEQVLQGVTTEQLLKHALIDDYLKMLLRLGKQQQFSSVYQAVLNQPLFSSQAIWQQNVEQFSLINPDFSDSKVSCENNIQPIATNLNDLHHWQQLTTKISTMPVANFVCFAPVRYLPITQLSCNNDLAEQPISCSFEQVKTVLRSVTSRYLLVLLPKGGANSQWGVVYLDVEDSAYVLQHELLHLLGLVDEYPLAPEHDFCQLQANSSINVVLLPKYYPDASLKTKHQILAKIPWAKQLNISQIQFSSSDLGFELKPMGATGNKNEIGLYLASTCDNSAQAKTQLAFKPLNQATALLQNQAKLPALYMQLIKQWQSKLKMPSFHYTVAYQAFANGNLEQAQYWLDQASKLELDNQRQFAIKHGEFEQLLTNFSH